MVTVPRMTFVRTAGIFGQSIFYLPLRVRLLRAGSDAQFKVVNATARGACKRKTRRNSNSIINMNNEMVPRLQISNSLSMKPNRTVDSDAPLSLVMWDGHAFMPTRINVTRGHNETVPTHQTKIHNLTLKKSY